MLLSEIVSIIFVLLMPIIFHEDAHAWMAYRLGDSIALDLVRLSVNPLKHLDPEGSVLLWATAWLPLPVTLGDIRGLPTYYQSLQ